MGRSPAFARIKSEVIDVVSRVPPGRVTTYAAIGEHLDVMARHVAYILATLTDDEREPLPWHRVVAADGATNRTKRGRGAEQRALLGAEGVVVARSGRVEDLESRLWVP